MYLVISDITKEIMASSEAINETENQIVLPNGDSYRKGYQGFTCYEVNDDIGEFELFKYCYTPEQGLYININWKREEPIEKQLVKINYALSSQGLLITEPNEYYDLEAYKTYKIKLLSAECNDRITEGIDVTTSLGTQHFSLTEKDQLNIFNRLAKVQGGATQVPYHADGEDCRIYTAQEIMTLGAEAEKYVTLCTTRYNMLKKWIGTLTTKEEVEAVAFDSVIPDTILSCYSAILALYEDTDNTNNAENTEENNNISEDNNGDGASEE